MTLIEIEAQDINCPVCQITVSSVTRQSRYSADFMKKLTSCCETLKVVHHKCADKFSKIIDNTYKVQI